MTDDVVIEFGPNGTCDVVGKLLDVMDAVTAVGKDGYNDHQGFKFRGVDQLVNVIGPLLREHRVLVVPNVVSVAHREIEVGAKKSPMGHAAVTMRYTFAAEDGSMIHAGMPGEANDSGDKATTKALSQAYKYLWNQGLCIPTDEPDPDSETHSRGEKPTKDDEAQAAGFDDQEQRLTQHRAAAARAKALGSPQEAKAWREEHGWPVTADLLAEFGELLDGIEDAQAPFEEASDGA